MSSSPPPGWYPDPSNDQQLRWWTGERWTGAARPIEPTPMPQDVDVGTWPLATHPGSLGGHDQPVGSGATYPAYQDVEDPHLHHDVYEPAAAAMAAQTAASYPPAAAEPRSGGGGSPARVDEGWPKERKLALAAFGVLVMTPLLIWLVAVVLQGRGGDDPAVTLDEPVGQEGDADAESTAPSETDDGESVEPSVDEDNTVDFDGRCEVELRPDQIEDGASLRPWQFDECRYAPIDLDAGEDRWIVVIRSIDGEASEDDARSALEEGPSGYALLWSSHYPSLNPGWWVIYDGPFAAEDAAADAAETAGGGAYPRVLSDDEGDRYCIAANGC